MTIDVQGLEAVDHVRGPPSAHPIVEFGDYECDGNGANTCCSVSSG